MFIEKQIPNRMAGEQLTLFLRRHWIVIIGHWLYYIVLATVPVILYYFLLNDYPELISNSFGYAFLLLLASLFYLYIILFFYNAFVDYYLDVWIVTNKRVINIEQKGLFNREISEHEIDKIQDVTGSQKGFFQTVFSYGDVHVQTAGEIQRFIFRQVNDPFEVVKIINHLIKDIRTETAARQTQTPIQPLRQPAQPQNTTPPPRQPRENK